MAASQDEMKYINFNGEIKSAAEPVFVVDNPALKYGFGLFETMLFRDGKIRFSEAHFWRLFSGLGLLNLYLPDGTIAADLLEKCVDLADKNKLTTARIRLSVYKSGSKYDDFIIEAVEMPAPIENYSITIFDRMPKACGEFSNLKHNNYMGYMLAAEYALNNNFNDALILNQFGRICDSSRANIFVIKNEIIFTPGLSEGPVAGIMRAQLLQQLPSNGYTVKECELSVDMLQDADEVFLSNAIRGVIPVSSFNGKILSTNISNNLAKITLADESDFGKNKI